MPYADPEEKRKQMKRWRKSVMAKGYGKWLYAKRKLVYQDAQEFGETLREIIALAEAPSNMSPEARLGAISIRAWAAVQASVQREEELGPWKGEEDDASNKA
jgi:deoxyribodipyrimidine photolyase